MLTGTPTPRSLVLAVATLAAALGASPAGAEASGDDLPPAVWAEQITRENAARLRVGGSDAVGGVGDWALGNGTLCAVVSDPSHEAHLSDRGGALVDLARCGVPQDQWVTQEMLLNMSRDEMLRASWIRAEPALPDGSVALVVGGDSEGLEIETRYRLSPERPDVLQIETRASRRPGTAVVSRAFLFGDVILHGRRQLAPFTLALDDRGDPLETASSVGFAHPPVDPDDMVEMVNAILTANLQVLVGGDRQRPGVAYGVRMLGGTLQTPEGQDIPLPSLAINGESFTMQAVFPRPFWVGGGTIGWLELAQSVLMDLHHGETLLVSRELRVGERSDVSSVTDQIWAHHPLVRGRVEPDARLHLRTAGGSPVTQTRPDPSGHFAFRAPPGRYRLRVLAPGGREEALDLTVDAGGVELGDVGLPATGRVRLPRGRMMRLVFVPEDGEPARFDDDLLDFHVGLEAFRGSDHGPDVVLSGSDRDPEQVVLPPGRYTVIATRGPTHDLARTQLEVPAGEVVPLVIDDPARVLDPVGWASTDLHVHSEWSDDSTYPVDRQIAGFAAEGASLIVSAEHDRVTDYGPVIRELGLEKRIATLTGAELTSSAHSIAAPRTAGHANAYPLPYDPIAPRGGSPAAEGRRLRDVIAEVRARPAEPGAPLVQLNHPRGNRADSDLNLFEHLSVAGQPFRPTLPLDADPNAHLLERSGENGLRDLDFDLFELWNGSSERKYRAARADWYSLMLQGELRPGVANSDSHVRGERIAYPRTFVRVPGYDGRTETLDRKTLLASLRAGRSYGSSGPLLDVSLVDAAGRRAGLGDTLSADAATLEVRVDAAPWIPVSRLRVFVNGAVAVERPVEAATPVRVPLQFGRDAFVTLEVRGEASDDYRRVAPGFRPFAFTNPIRVDADGDGRFTAPGLPPQALPALDPDGLD